MIRLGQMDDSRLVIASSQPFPAPVRHVEYYRDMKLFLLMFDLEGHEGDLMPCDISEDIAGVVESAPGLLTIAMFESGKAPYGYDVPLIQVGI